MDVWGCTMRTREWAMSAMALGLLGGCASKPDALWARQDHLNQRYVASQLPAAYAAMNRLDEAARNQLHLEHAKRSADTGLVMLASKISCDFGFTQEQRDFMAILRHFHPNTIEQGEDGRVYNAGVIFGRNDWVSLDAPLTLQRATPHTGETGHAGRAVYTYALPADTTFDAKIGEVYNTLTLSGTIDIARTNPTRAPDAAPSVVDALLVVRENGRTLRLTLDKASPFSTLHLDARGRGLLGMAMKIESEAATYAGVVYVGSSIYFEIPVEANVSWTRLRIVVPIARPGNELTPARDTTLLAADGPFQKLDINTDPWADSNANGILDGADRLLWIYYIYQDELYRGY